MQFSILDASSSFRYLIYQQQECFSQTSFSGPLDSHFPMLRLTLFADVVGVGDDAFFFFPGEVSSISYSTFFFCTGVRCPNVVSVNGSRTNQVSDQNIIIIFFYNIGHKKNTTKNFYINMASKMAAVSLTFAPHSKRSEFGLVMSGMVSKIRILNYF